jgi:hypothetical protein
MVVERGKGAEYTAEALNQKAKHAAIASRAINHHLIILELGDQRRDI